MLGFNRYDLILLINLLKMNVRDRYLGSSLGGIWAVANPLFMLGLYTYVFGFVFKVRLPGAETTMAYVIWLISGYGAWIALQESIMSSANSVLVASGLVKNMAFKTELLPIAGVLIGFINLIVSMCFLIVLLIWTGKGVSWHIIFLPILMALQFLFAAALGMWLSAAVVFLRDIVQILPSAMTVLMFITPIFYSLESMPSVIQKISLANPLYQIVEGYRSIIISNQVPSLAGLVYVFVFSLIVFYFGLRAFRRAKGHFDSVI